MECPVMVTYSGVWFPLDPFELREEHIKLDDIVWHLSMRPRWEGAVTRPYSVAEHSIFVSELAEEHYREFMRASSEIMEPKDIAYVRLYALLYDAHEAYPPGDVCSPWKKIHPEISTWQRLVQEIIYGSLNLTSPDELQRKVIAVADRSALVAEAAGLLTFAAYGQVRSHCPEWPWGELRSRDFYFRGMGLPVAEVREQFHELLVGLLEEVRNGG